MNELNATTMDTRDAGRPVVGIVMRSDSDWSAMGAAVEVFDEFKVVYEVDVVSAHRMSTEMTDYGRAVAEWGPCVIIAGTGGAAHLPGMLAAATELLVIGVPASLKHLDGMDSLLSIVQVPAGVPVVIASTGGARNARLLAVRILASGQGPEAVRLGAITWAFQVDLSKVAHARDATLRERLSH